MACIILLWVGWGGGGGTDRSTQFKPAVVTWTRHDFTTHINSGFRPSTWTVMLDTEQYRHWTVPDWSTRTITVTWEPSAAQVGSIIWNMCCMTHTDSLWQQWGNYFTRKELAVECHQTRRYSVLSGWRMGVRLPSPPPYGKKWTA